MSFSDILWSYARLFISLCHIQFGSELCLRYIMMYCILIWEGYYILPCILVLLLQIEYGSWCTVFLWYTQHWCHLFCSCWHPPVVVYHSIFWASSEQNTSGHLGNLCLSCFDSSIKGILCVLLHEMEVTSMEVALINCCTSQRFPHATEEYLNMYTHSGFSLNPLTSGSDSSHFPSCHSLWDLTF